MRKILALAALPAAAAILAGCSSSASTYGQSPADAARKYTTCAAPMSATDETVRCGLFAVYAPRNSAEQNDFLDAARGDGAQCWVSMPGLVVIAAGAVPLTAAFGEPPANWASKHHGVAECA